MTGGFCALVNGANGNSKPPTVTGVFLLLKTMLKRDYIYSDQMSIFGSRQIIGFGNHDFRVQEIDRDLANETIKKNHYSGKITQHTYIHLGVYIDDCMVGVLQAGHAMNPQSGGSLVTGATIDNFIELNRMWLHDDAPRNSESMAISYLIKFIRANYPRIKFMQSFADERCGCFGIVYQAANFQYYGEHTNIFWELDGVVYHNSIMTNGENQSKNARFLRQNKDRAHKFELRQFRYIYWIDRSWKLKCNLTERPYPKHYTQTEQKINISNG